MIGYLNRPEATKNTILEGHWLRSGDLGYYDESGEVFVIDRLKDVIKYKTMQVTLILPYYVINLCLTD